MADYATFIARVRRELEEGSQSTWSDLSLLEWTNDAMRDFASRVKPAFDEQYAYSVLDQESYDMPHYTLEVVRVAYDGSFLYRMNEHDYFVYSTAFPTSGTPVRYCVAEGVLYLHPKPDADSKEIRVWRRYAPDPITSTTDTTEMPYRSEYNDAFSYFVKARAYEQVGDFDSAKVNDQLYQREVDDAIWMQLNESTGDYFHEPTVVW